MKITVIGAGHVGVPHAVTLARKCPRATVTVCDHDTRKVAAWRSSLLPFYEPALEEVLAEVRGENLHFELDMPKAIASADMIFVSVSTPLKDGGFGHGYAPDLQHWERIARAIAEASPTPKPIVERSTVPVKTADLMAKVLKFNSGGQEWTVLSNPEFAREGNAMVDHASPERIMIGAAETAEARAAAATLVGLYQEWVPASKIITSGLWSAELSKLTANAFLAQRISSINAISALCESTGADVTEVAFAVGVDSRIGKKHLQASVGFGGACYETHLRNLVYLCRYYRLPEVATYWESVLRMNNYQKRRFSSKIVASMFNTVSGKKLAILGFAYKKNTSDTRYTVALDVCKSLLAEKAILSVHDPRVASEAISVALTADDGNEALLSVEADPYLACAGAHALVVLTEWDTYARLDFRAIYEAMQKPAFVFDGRNLLNHEELREIGFSVYGIGKPPPPKPPVGTSEEMAALAEEHARLAQAEQGRIKAGAERLPPPITGGDGGEGGDGAIVDLSVGEGSPTNRSPQGSPSLLAPSGPSIARKDTFGSLS